jgi:hypothetical protein
MGKESLPSLSQLRCLPPPIPAGLFLPATPSPKSKAGNSKTSKGRYPLALASHSPIFRASLVQTSAALRPFHFRCAPVARVGIPLGLQLLPPTFARRRSACRYMPRMA